MALDDPDNDANDDLTWHLMMLIMNDDDEAWLLAGNWRHWLFLLALDAADSDFNLASSQVEDFIRLRALLALEGTYPSDGSFTKVPRWPRLRWWLWWWYPWGAITTEETCKCFQLTIVSEPDKESGRPTTPRGELKFHLMFLFHST